MTRYSIELSTRKCVRGYGFLSFARNMSKIHGETAKTTKTRLDAAKPVSRNVFHKTVEATGELIGNKIARKL